MRPGPCTRQESRPASVSRHSSARLLKSTLPRSIESFRDRNEFGVAKSKLFLEPGDILVLKRSC